MERRRALIDAAALGLIGGVLIVTFGQLGQLVAIAALAVAAAFASGRLEAFVGAAGAVSATIFSVASLACVQGPGQQCRMDSGTATLIGISVLLALAGGLVAVVTTARMRT